MAETPTTRRPLGAVFVLSVLICGAIGLWGVLAPDALAGAANALTGFALTTLDWVFLMLCTSFVVLGGALALGPYGKIKLGADDDEPEFSTVSWIAMLFAGGMGAGLLFWGPAEPLYHFTDPPGLEGGTPEAARLSMVLTNLHWGLHAWSIYGVCALVLAYFIFRRGMPGMISTPMRATLPPSAATRNLGIVSDVIAVFAVVFGLAGSLVMGVLQVRAGVTEVFGLQPTTALSVFILALMAAAFMISTSSGLDKGMKLLSNLNMLLVMVLLAVVLVFGPTAYIMEAFVNGIGDYFSALPAYAFRLLSYENQMDWTNNWTLTYLIWWVAWGPFVGIFIARISRGRTIREFCLGVIVVPSIFSLFWFAALGSTGIWVELNGSGGLAALVTEDVAKALFAFLDYMPAGILLASMAIVLIFLFLVTSADSGTFVISMMTSEGTLNPKTALKLAWGATISLLTLAILLSGSVEVAKAMAAFGAVPFTVILVLQIVSFLRALREEPVGKRAQEQPA